MVHENDIKTLLDDLLEVYGYDFSEYTQVSLQRRINRLFVMDKFASVAEFRYRLRTDISYMERFVQEITVNVTEMFRDPHFHKRLREEILPTLGTYPMIRIWLAGCSTGEEVYSLAIMLHEQNLLSRSLLYATDINPDVLESARQGLFPLTQMKQYSKNYIGSGGEEDFSKYYTAGYNYAKFNEYLSKRMIFSTHNLVCDRSFNEFQLVLCRNVLIYFDKELQNRVFKLFDKSLEKLGFLALGTKESLRFSPVNEKYKEVSRKEKIYRKIA